MMIFLVWGFVAAMAADGAAMGLGDLAAAERDYRMEVEALPSDVLVAARSDEGEAAEPREKDFDSSRPRREKPEAEVVNRYRYYASLSYDFSQFSPDRGPWRNGNVTVRRYWSAGSLGFEYLEAERFGLGDLAFALDAYVDLWRRGYANLRYQYSPEWRPFLWFSKGPPPGLFPEVSYRMELFQGIGKGWEPSGSYDHMAFGNNNVDMYGAGLGKYTGNWYLRWRTLLIPSTARMGVAHLPLARYYYAGNGDDYIEINGGLSRGGEFVRGTRIVETTESRSVGAAFRNFFHPCWGIKFSMSYDDDVDSFVERRLATEVFTRW